MIEGRGIGNENSSVSPEPLMLAITFQTSYLIDRFDSAR